MAESDDSYFTHDPATDPLLAMLVTVASASRWDLRIELAVAGCIVTGQPIDAVTYGEMLDEQLKPHDQEMGHPAGFLRHHLRRIVTEAPWPSHSDSLIAGLAPRWIHLADVVFDGRQRMHRSVWRVRGADVSGWSIVSA